MTTAEVVPMRGAQIDQEAVLRTLNLNPRDPSTQALLLICERYGLDPLLKHMVLIQGRPYVTRDGYLHLAHKSGALDGVEVLDEGDDGQHWWARVSVFRKDMSRPFTYRGRYPKQGGNKAYGPEMAIKCAEVAALRRAFNVTGIGAADEKWDADDVHTTDPVDEPPTADKAVIDALLARVEEMPSEARSAFRIWKDDQGFPWPWPVDACAAMSAELDRIETEAGGSADSETGAEPALAPASELPAATDESALAGQPCGVCNSTRTKRVLAAGGEVRCHDEKGCADRSERLNDEARCLADDCTDPPVDGTRWCKRHEQL